MRKPNVYSACYAIIKNEKGEILFQKRQNTGYRDGTYQLPAGHIEHEERMKECLVREMKEELGIKILEEDLDIMHISHRVCKGERTYFDIYLLVKKYNGNMFIAEPEKCSELLFVDTEELENEKLFGFDLDVIKMIQEGINFSEING